MGFNRRRKQCRNYFGGTFDGQGHIVKDLTCTSPGNGAYGFLGVISQTGTVQNLGIVNANLQTPSNAASTNMGILADWANQAKVINCYTTGVVSSAHQSGGFQLVGGLIGQWENATEDAVIWDSYFDGSIVCEYTDVGVGGILGANFDFRGMPGVTIRNCFVSTTDITCAEPGNITWIAAVVDSEVTNCYWPVSPGCGKSVCGSCEINFRSGRKLVRQQSRILMRLFVEQRLGFFALRRNPFLVTGKMLPRELHG